MGAPRLILQQGDPRLSRRAAPVRPGDPTQDLIEDLLATLRTADGIGLAAPQIGIARRVIVVELAAAGTAITLALVNPVIVRAHGHALGNERCLSLPGFVGSVPRATHVEVEALDPAERPVRLSAVGLLARVLQHEIDHLDGILFPARATVVQRQPESSCPSSPLGTGPARN